MAERWERLLGGPYFICADRWGWPPTVVDEQPAILLDDLTDVAIVVEGFRRDQAERAREE